MAAIRTTCAYCGVGCGIAARVTGPRRIEVAGDPDHPANHGRLCSKGTWLSETTGLEGRLLHPMIGEEQAEWDEALDLVAQRMRTAIAEHGPDSVAFYVSGQLLTEDYYVANKLLKGFVGTANIDTNSRLCMASAVAAHNRAFGEDVVPCSYDDLDRADLILLVGSNTAWCHPVIWQRIEQAREQHGTRLVVIDPRRTETAERADLHVPVAPDGDVALFNALLAAMRDRGLLDADYMAKHCEQPGGFIDGLNAAAHGLDPDIFASLCDLVADHPRMVTLFSQGANQSVCGTDKGNAIINLHLATGRINRAGSGPFSMTGQPNAMGGREVGGLANMLACHLGFEDEERDAVAAFWNAPNLCSGPGSKAVEMFRAVHDGRIKFLWVMGTNPAVSMPDAGFVREALARCETLVVSEVIAETDTAKLADIRLPALGWGEKDGTVTNSERRVSRQRALLPAPGEARADWRIMCDVAHRLGHGAAFAFEHSADIFAEYAAMTRLSIEQGRLLDLTGWAGCSQAEYDAMEPFRWGGDHPTAGRFAFPDGKARIVAVQPAVQPPVDPDFPLRLNTGRYRDQWHTMTRTGLSPKLSIHRREPLVEIAPADAQRFALEEGGFAQVATPWGHAVYRVAVTDGQRAGEIFVPMHWTDLTGSGRTGRLMHPAVDPVSGQPGFKNVAATIAPVTPDWRGFLVTREAVRPGSLFWALSRVEGGWLTELAGMGAVDVEGLLPQGTRSEAADKARGMTRIVVRAEDGALAAVLYLTRSGSLPDRDWVARQFVAEDASAIELLAGRPAQPAPDRGKLVCLCLDVGENEVRSAIRAGCARLNEIADRTGAGSNCGSCRPLIARMVEEEEALASRV
ncbi:nitrate reductase [Croceicoccus marinus]|uniref:Molybdopterin-dependent oxidoreductase n=1 Tax=Croceicoccus marinus TaxID=450378 RepID=A0A7G6VY46_9SPHN|nr:nitrate reductase [Croceicoccus marinus]QNE06661.1 molybdopterin-dependent oxidoreductase [Croceicoccus marinus]